MFIRILLVGLFTTVFINSAEKVVIPSVSAIAAIAIANNVSDSCKEGKIEEGRKDLFLKYSMAVIVASFMGDLRKKLFNQSSRGFLDKVLVGPLIISASTCVGSLVGLGEHFLVGDCDNEAARFERRPSNKKAFSSMVALLSGVLAVGCLSRVGIRSK